MPLMPTDECAFRDARPSKRPSGHAPLLATTGTSPALSATVAKAMPPCLRTDSTQPATVASCPSMDADRPSESWVLRMPPMPPMRRIPGTRVISFSFGLIGARPRPRAWR